MSGIWFGFEIAVGLVIGVVVTIRVLMFLRLVKYRRGNVYDAPEDLRPRLMRENLEVMRRKAETVTREDRKELFTMLMSSLMEPWDKETYAEITKTLAHVASLDKENHNGQLKTGKQLQHVPPKEFVRDRATRRLIPFSEWEKAHPLTPEQREENRLELLKEFLPKEYEKEMKKAKPG